MKRVILAVGAALIAATLIVFIWPGQAAKSYNCTKHGFIGCCFQGGSE